QGVGHGLPATATAPSPPLDSTVAPTPDGGSPLRGFRATTGGRLRRRVRRARDGHRTRCVLLPPRVPPCSPASGRSPPAADSGPPTPLDNALAPTEGQPRRGCSRCGAASRPHTPTGSVRESPPAHGWSQCVDGPAA